MENKINLAELLKDCPHGMELDCVLFNNPVIYDGLDNEDNYPITILTENDDYLYLTEEGYLYSMPNSKCVIFPKGKTTWEGFVPPCQFKDGDIVSTMNGIWIGIVKRPVSGACETYVTIYGDSLVYNENIYCFERLATEEEKQKLFQAIKDNGYKWNTETKTLERLVVPKFKVGDMIKMKVGTETIEFKSEKSTIIEIKSDGYILGDVSGEFSVLPFVGEDYWELVPNKFDISTLKPFDKVLVRDSDIDMWRASIFSHTWKDKYFCISGWHNQCIPYEVNKHILGTNNDCDNFYKVW